MFPKSCDLLCIVSKRVNIIPGATMVRNMEEGTYLSSAMFRHQDFRDGSDPTWKVFSATPIDLIVLRKASKGFSSSRTHWPASSVRMANNDKDCRRSLNNCSSVELIQLFWPLLYRSLPCPFQSIEIYIPGYFAQVNFSPPRQPVCRRVVHSFFCPIIRIDLDDLRNSSSCHALL